MARRTKYRKDYCGQVIRLMQDGHSIASVAKELGVSISTIYRWEKNPELPVVVFGAHEQAEQLEQARKSGADEVLPRSKLSKDLAKILTHYAQKE